MEYSNINILRGCLIGTALAASSCSSLVVQLGDSESVCKEQSAYIYGGTVRNTNLAFGGLSAAAAGQDKVLALFVAGPAIIDFPFSLVADTLFLPLSVPRTIFGCTKYSIPETSGFLL